MVRLLALVSMLCLATVQPASAALLANVEQPNVGQPSDELASAEAADYPPLPTVAFAGEYFVTQQYRDMLGRDPDDTGLGYWTSRLDDTSQPAELIAQLVESPEFGAVRIPVARIYQAALGRLPEHDGWRYWSNRLAAGESLESIAAALINTPEGQLRLPQDSDDQFIDALYNNVLERQPDASGRSYWQATLSSGRSMASVVVNFAESPEFATKLAPEIHASLLYEGLLGRTPDTEGLTFWSNELSDGRSYVSAIGAFINAGEYERRLRSLWCDTITLDEALDWSDGEPIFDERYARAHASSQELAEALASNETWPDEVTTQILDSKPQISFVLGIHEPSLTQACLPILALTSHPEVVQFAPTQYLTSELRTISEAIQALGGVEWIGSGRGLLNVGLSAAALPVAEQIVSEYGDALESFTVGAFPYPMPSPLPDVVCHNESALAVDAGDLGLTITLDLPASVVSGGVASGTFTVTNTGTGTYTLYWGYEVTGYLGSGSTSQSIFTGSRNDPLSAPTIGPSESASGRLDIGTAACDPADGHALAAGSYETWGSIAVVDHAVQDSSVQDATHFIRLPATPLTLTD